jgi:hypothetical protein
MKKENLRLKDMDQYITKTPLNMVEANKVFEMEHDGQRNFDIPFVYLAINTIKQLERKGYDISKLPKTFLNRISALSFDDAANLINIMFFLEDLEMNDIYKAIMTFYDFFNDDVNYDDDRLNTIKNYITFDNDLLTRIFRTILMIDINLLAGPDNIKFFEYYYKVDPTILMNHFNENKMNFDENFNKNLFKSQLSYIRFFIEQKTIQK